MIALPLVYHLSTKEALAQKTDAVRLLDQSTNMPIVGATYQYGQKSGQSDEKGTIKFNFIEEINMVLSHVSYGKWELSASALKSAIGSGVSYKESSAVNLYPVTVIALRPALD